MEHRGPGGQGVTGWSVCKQTNGIPLLLTADRQQRGERWEGCCSAGLDRLDRLHTTPSRSTLKLQLWPAEAGQEPPRQSVSVFARPGLGQDHTCSEWQSREQLPTPARHHATRSSPVPPPTSCQSLSLMSLPCFVQFTITSLHHIAFSPPGIFSFFLSSQQPPERMISTINSN